MSSPRFARPSSSPTRSSTVASPSSKPPTSTSSLGSSDWKPSSRPDRVMPRPSPERDLLLSALDEAFERQAWHGPNLLGTLRRVNAAQAAWRPGPGRHNIWEIALHTAYWKNAASRRLTGE